MLGINAGGLHDSILAVSFDPEIGRGKVEMRGFEIGEGLIMRRKKIVCVCVLTTATRVGWGLGSGYEDQVPFFQAEIGNNREYGGCRSLPYTRGACTF
jgi:hypothetical protein